MNVCVSNYLRIMYVSMYANIKLIVEYGCERKCRRVDAFHTEQVVVVMGITVSH